MRLPPLDVIASWPRPNYTDPERRGPALLIINLTIMPIALITLVLRMYVRLFVVRRCKVDDWLMCVAMVFGIGVTVCVILASQKYGWDIHVWDLRADQMVSGRKASIAAQTMFLFASGRAKTSILISYRRIAPLDSWFRRLTNATIALVVALLFVFLIVLWTQCFPASDYWNFTDGHHCLPEGPPLMAQTTLTVITDFITYILPLPTLINLRLPTLQRVVLICVFSLGFIVVLAGCMRTYWIYEVVTQTYDVTWNGYMLWIWTAVEVDAGVICGCVPTLRPLFKGSLGASYASKNAQGNTGGKNMTFQPYVAGGEHAQQSSRHRSWLTTTVSRLTGNGRPESLHSGGDDVVELSGKKNDVERQAEPAGATFPALHERSESPSYTWRISGSKSPT